MRAVHANERGPRELEHDARLPLTKQTSVSGESGLGSRVERYRVGQNREGSIAEKMQIFPALPLFLRPHRVPAGP